MSYALIWLEVLAAALLLVATAAACVARWPRRWQRLTVLLLVTLPLFGAAAGVTFLTGVLKYQVHLDWHGFSYTLSWTVLFTAGAAVLFYYGLGSANSWPRGRLALAFLTAAALLYITVANVDLAMRTQQASLRAEASAKLLALTPPRVPDADNAAFIYEQAFDNLTPRDQLPPAWKDKAALWLNPEQKWFDHQEKPFDPKDKDLLDYLSSQEHAVMLLHKAAAMPSCSFDYHYTGSIALPLPELGKLRHAPDVLALHAIVRASDGDLRVALSDIDAILGIARHIAREPDLGAEWYAMRLEIAAVRTWEKVLAQGELKPEYLTGPFLTVLPSHRHNVVRAIQVEEAAFGLAYFGMLGDEPMLDVGMRGAFPDSGPSAVVVSLWRIFHMPDDVAAYRRLMARMRQLAERPYYEVHADWQNLMQGIRMPTKGLVTSNITPDMWKLAVEAAEADAYRRLARLAVAAVQYKAKNGKYPKSMDELTPMFLSQPLLDPFDGKPLGLRADGDGLILSSRPDTPWHRKDLGQGEIVFRLK
jgi:hypothetical protein